MAELQAAGLKAFFRKLAELMVARKDELTELDAAIGDGDLGLTMTKGFAAVSEALAGFGETDVGKILSKAGATLAAAAPSTMGTLLATGLLRAGQAVLGRAGLDLAGLAQMLEAFVEGISARGKAKPGDKTILDSLYPALEALRGACEQQLSLVDGVAAAYQAAVQGLAATKEMVSQHGKAACFGERTLGRQDPGATVGAYICEALLATVQDGEGLG